MSCVIDGVDHWWFRDRLVERYRADYDLNGALRQLGLVPEAGSRGEKLLVSLQRAAGATASSASLGLWPWLRVLGADADASGLID